MTLVEFQASKSLHNVDLEKLMDGFDYVPIDWEGSSVNLDDLKLLDQQLGTLSNTSELAR